MSKGKLFIISGPSGAGKGTICKRLIDETKVEISVSMTTRQPREGEVEGKSYYFTTKEDFLKAVEADGFLEWAEVYGNYYGTPKSAVEQRLSEGKDVVLDIEIQGARNVKKMMPEAALVYLLPPSIEELKRRLVGRNTEDAETVAGRLHTARTELNEAPELYDYFIVNDLVENAAIKIKDIIEGERCSKNAMQETLKQILEEAENLA